MRLGPNHGGRRVGSGRKPSMKAALGPPFIRKLREEARVAIADLIGTERDPLNVVIDIALNPAIDIPTRLEAALGACNFIHPRLSAMAVQTQNIPPGGDDGAERLRMELEALSERRRGTRLLEIDSTADREPDSAHNGTALRGRTPAKEAA
jgi:hypothetical protein